MWLRNPIATNVNPKFVLPVTSTSQILVQYMYNLKFKIIKKKFCILRYCTYNKNVSGKTGICLVKISCIHCSSVRQCVIIIYYLTFWSSSLKLHVLGQLESNFEGLMILRYTCTLQKFYLGVALWLAETLKIFPEATRYKLN